MKSKYIIFLFAMSFFSVPVSAQNSSDDWYPLAIGNYWEYYSPPEPYTINEGRSAHTVISDSLFENNKRYFVIQIKDIFHNPNEILFYKYLRYENDILYSHTNSVCPGNENIEYNFSLPDSTWWEKCIKFSDTTEKFGKLTTGYSIIRGVKYLACTFTYAKVTAGHTEWNPCCDFPSYYFVKGLGFFENLTGAIINGVIWGTISGVDKINSMKCDYKLFQNYPNPFNPSTVISYQIPAAGKVTLKIFDILGNEITMLVNEEKSAGNYSVDFNASNLPSGVYFYSLKSGGFVETKKLLLIK